MINCRILTSAVLSAFLVLSCESGQTVRQAPPEQSTPSPATGAYSAALTPRQVFRGSTVGVIPSGFDLSQASVTWLVNGKPLEGVAGPQLNLAALDKGDIIRARIIIEGQVIESDQIEISNSPPEIVKVDIRPESGPPGGTISIDAAAQDPDGDEVAFSYEWTLNGAPAGSGRSMEGLLKRGDAVTVKITPFDGTDYGQAVVLRREIANMRPLIVAHQEFTFDGSVYTYQVKASDPDGDTLTYSLRSAVPGISLESSTGLLRWHVPAGFKGTQRVTITVSDGQGGITEYTPEFIIQ